MPPTPLLHNISDLIRGQWNIKAFKTAKDTEKTAIAAGQKLTFSTHTAEALEKFITVDPEMIRLKEKVQLLQAENDPILIIGPTGTGKELIAQALHGARSGKFVDVNCTSLPDQLIESELFGHTEGAFTGAIKSRKGKFIAAYNGTIFLDEIGDMPLNMQSKLLRVLQEKTVYPIGSDVPEPINCRVVAATNKTLEELLEKKIFREDLLWRLNIFTLETKGLRDRLCDIEEIVDSLGGESLVNEFEKWKKEHGWDVNDRILSYLGFFSLEGNVRSLQSQVRKWLVLKER